MKFFELLFHLLWGGLGDDTKWRALLDYVGMPQLYTIFFIIIFCETGLVVTPFLPGDSLIFAIGAIGARELGINLPLMAVLLSAAAILGDAVNYWIGFKLGPAVFRKEDSKLLNKKHLLRAQEFYEKYGAKTIILARFVPIVRTFAPFVAGVGKMNFFRFWLYNIIGGVAWVLICLFSGYYFGTLPFVKKHFELVLVAIIFVSLLPMLIEFLRARSASKKAAVAPTAAVGSESNR
jgi:membrane-associated protein